MSTPRAAFARIEPYELAVFDADRAAQGLPPWRGIVGPGDRFYTDEEVEIR